MHDIIWHITTVCLIRVISAVIVAITAIEGADAKSIGTLEIRSWAICSRKLCTDVCTEDQNTNSNIRHAACTSTAYNLVDMSNQIFTNHCFKMQLISKTKYYFIIILNQLIFMVLIIIRTVLVVFGSNQSVPTINA